MKSLIDIETVNQVLGYLDTPQSKGACINPCDSRSYKLQKIEDAEYAQ